MPKNTIHRSAKTELIEHTHEYIKLKRLRIIFIFSLIGTAFSFLQYYDLLPIHYLSADMVFIVDLWAALGSAGLLLFSLYCYIARHQLTRDMLALENLERGNVSPEVENFNEIDPNNDDHTRLNDEEEATLEKISQESIVFMLISVVAVFVQTKIGAYHEIPSYISWLINFIN